MGTASLNLGAINIDSTRSNNTNIGDSSSTAGVLRLYGSTVNSVANVIIRNDGSGTLTLQALQNGTMGVVLSNATNNIINIDGSGGVAIASIVSDGTGGAKQLTLGGTGTGSLTLSGANTYTGATTVSQGKLTVTNATGSGTGAGAVAVGSNTGVAVLSGTGTISGLTTASTTGGNIANIAPGLNSSGAGNNFGVAGTLKLNGGLSLGNNSAFDFDLAGTAAGTSDLITMNGTGALTLGSAFTINYNLLTAGIVQTGANYTLVSGATSITSLSSVTITSTGLSGYTASYSVSGGSLLVSFSSTSNSFWDTNGTTAGSGNAGGNWSAGNWNSAADGTGTPGNFTDGATPTFSAGTDGTGAFTVNVDTTVNANGLNFEEGNVTLAHASGGILNLTGPSVNVATGSTATISEAIHGSVGLTKLLPGSLILSGNNDYTGATSVSAGVLNIRSANALGATGSGNGTSVVSGAALEIQGGITTAAEDLTINGTGISNNGALRNISGDNTYAGVITLGSNSAIGVDANSLTVTQGITDGASTFSLTKVGAGSLILNGTNTYKGNTTISNGTLALGAAGTINTSPTVSVVSGATWDLTAKTSGYLLASAQTLSGLGTVTLASGQSLSVGSGATISPNTSTTTGNLTVGGLSLASGGTYQFTLTNVAGTAGAVSGWDLISVSNALVVGSTAGSPFNITISASGSTGFSNTSNYAWTIATASSITGFDPTKFSFTNNIANSNGTFSLSSDGTNLTLNYAAGTITPILWSSSGGSAWLTNTNWTGSAVPTGTDIAQFSANPTSATTGVGINMGNPTNNGSNNEAVGAIEVTSGRSNNLIIGNSSAGTAGTLTLNGATVAVTGGNVANVVLHNASNGGTLTLQNTAVSGGSTMAVALGNATNNVVVIDGTGGITINSIISGVGRNLTRQGVGTGTFTLGGANTFSGTFTASTGATNLSVNNALGGVSAVSIANGASVVTSVGGLTNAINDAAAVTNNGTLDLSGGSETVGSLAIKTTATLLLGKNGSLSGSFTVGDSSSTNFAGIISDGAAGAGTGTFTKQGGGTLALAGTSANTFTGLTVVSAGELDLNKTAGVNAIAGDGNTATNDVNVAGGTLKWLTNEQVQNSTTITVSGGTVDLNGHTETLGSLIVNGGTFTTNGSGTGGSLTGTTATVDFEGGVSTITNGGSVTDGHIIIGSGIGTVGSGNSVEVQGGGTLTLQTGGIGMVMSGGTLTLDSSNTTAGKARFAKSSPGLYHFHGQLLNREWRRRFDSRCDRHEHRHFHLERQLRHADGFRSSHQRGTQRYRLGNDGPDRREHLRWWHHHHRHTLGQQHLWFRDGFGRHNGQRKRYLGRHWLHCRYWK